jgi:methyl-accepting chemotaxis protein
MLNRVSINTILNSVIAILAAAVVIVLAFGAMSSWSRLAAVNRIAAVADASAYMFTALHNLRVDRATGFRDLNADKQLTAMTPLLREAREAEMPALKSALIALDAIDFPERQAAVSGLGQAIKKLTALHEESAAAFLKPKAERRPGLAQEYFNETNALIAMLDKLSSQVTKSVKLDDAFIDQLMELKQLAWVARNAGGDSSVMISNALGGVPLPPDAMLKFTASMSRLDTAWSALEDVAAGLPLPPRFNEAVAKAKREFFAADFADLRLKTLNALLAGQKVAVSQPDWARMSVGKLGSLLGVAEAALDVAKDHAAAQRASATRMLGLELALLVAALLLAGGMMLLVSRRVTGPLGQMQAAMIKLAGGDFGVAVPGLERKDEIGAMANAVERFKVLADEKARHEADEAMRRRQGEAAVHAKAAEERAKIAEEQAQAFHALGVGLGKLSSGDLTFRLSDGFSEDYKQIRDDFNNTIAQLQETIGSIVLSTREVASTATEISSSTTDLSQRTEEQAASLEQTSAAMEEISTTVKKNAESAHQANQVTHGTREVADRGGAVVAQAVGAMARIEESSRKISDIISVIDEIARQTNLLALNAAVEAARAGEAGRGFAVVASEVRSLAQRSSQAAKDIKDLITNSSNQVQEGVELVNRAGASLTEIVESIKKVAEIVSEIASASGEQSSGCDQVNIALTQMDQMTQQNSALVEENAAAAKALEQQSHAMDEQISFFRLGDHAMPQVAVAGWRRPAAEAAPQQPAAPARHHSAAAPAHRAVATPKPQPGAAPPRSATAVPQRPAAAAPPRSATAAPQRSAAAVPQRPAAAAPQRPAAAAPQRPVAAVPQRPAATPPRPAPAAMRGPVGRMQAALATAINDDADWKEF